MALDQTLYLDHCGSTPLCEDVKAKLHELLDNDSFGNPSASHHLAGLKADRVLTAARLEISTATNAAPEDIIFTGGATEANNLVLWGHALRYQGRKPRILYGATEHKSVYETCIAINSHGLAITEEVAVLSDGSVDLDKFERQLMLHRGQPTLVALMHINNEIPARHPIDDIARLCNKYGAFFHSDGVQGFVREPLDFSHNVFGSYVISPHKLYGPKGVGVLILGKNALSPRVAPVLIGGDQERGHRPGTPNLLAIAGAATAISLHNNRRTTRVQHMQRCVDSFLRRLSELTNQIHLTIPYNPAGAGIVNFYVDKLDAPTLLEQIPNVCINKGSSCLGANGEKFSHVPRALGLPIEIQANVLRASFGDAITEKDSALAAEQICGGIQKINNPH